jgi:OOP family OmpA-OmpF porin
LQPVRKIFCFLCDGKQQFVKRISFFISFFLYFHTCYSQSADKKTAVTVYGGTIQYKGEFGNQFFNTGKLHPAFAASIAQYLSAAFNLGLMYTEGDVRYANGGDRVSGNMGSMNLFIHYKFFNGKILKENARIAPYVITGFGAADWNESQPVKTRFTDAFIPVGAGIRIRLTNAVAVLLQSQLHFTMSDGYEQAISEKGKDYFLHTMLGFSCFIGEGKDSDGDRVKDRKDHCPGTPAGVAVNISGCPLDRDSDGVPDYLDLCPELAGPLSAKGCPDKDQDSIADAEDHCPEIAGPLVTSGCPDSDLDGVLDADDSCPDEKGLAALRGCPDRDADGVADKDDECPDEKGVQALDGCPDRDHDGIADKNDLCPDAAGIAENKGCPELIEAVENILNQVLTDLQFETGKDKIRKSSFKILDEVVTVMNAHPEYKLVISGHTDNTGKSAKNQLLSEKRAFAAKNYLTAHGIAESRITSAGYGDTVPLTGNKTKTGRAKNRRVEFKVVF